MSEVERSITSMSWLPDPRAFREVMVQRGFFVGMLKFSLDAQFMHLVIASCADIAVSLKI